ncbi:hypothetical protein LXL04_010179 [Taraxacum kok-saghyz]
MGRDDVHQWGFLPPTEAPSLYSQEQRDDRWRHFDKSVNAISFGFVATAILISMFLVMAIFERFLRTTSPVLSPSGGGPGGRNAAGDVDSQMGFNSKLAHSSLKDTRFWEEKWSDKGILKNSFPRLYALETDKKAKVKDRLSLKVDLWDRRREIRDGREREEVTNMEDTIDSQNLSDKRDRWEIPGAPNGIFSTTWIRDCMETFKIMGQVQQNHWNKWVPKKHNIFVWRFIRDRIPTRRKLVDMGIDIPTSLCPLCERREETLAHLFFECDLSSQLWSKLGVWWAVQTPSFSTGEELMSWSWFSMKNRKDGVRLQVAIMAVLITIWRARNGVIFDKKKVEVISQSAREVSVLMPGEDVPTFIAQPAPVPCPSGRIPWSPDPRVM